MPHHARRLRDESSRTHSAALIDPEVDSDTDEMDVAAYVAMSIPRVSDRQTLPSRYEERT